MIIKTIKFNDLFCGYNQGGQNNFIILLIFKISNIMFLVTKYFFHRRKVLKETI